MKGDILVEVPAADVEPGDCVWRNNDLFRCYEVERDPLRHLVTLRLEACRWGDWIRAESALVAIEKLS